MRRQLARFSGHFLPLSLLGSTGGACDSGRDVVLADITRDGSVKDASSQGDGDGNDASTTDPEGDGGNQVCAWVDAKVERRPLTLWLVIQSSSLMMVENGRYWRALKQAFVGADGIVPQNAAKIRFGAVAHGADTSTASCPGLTIVPPGFDQAQPIEELFASEPSTSDISLLYYALHHVRTNIDDGFDGPRAVFIARYRGDSLDDLCDRDIDAEDDWGGLFPGLPWIYDDARALAAMNVPLYVVDFRTVHYDKSHNESAELAAIGNTGHGPFYAGDQPSEAEGLEALLGILDTVLAESVSCEFSLNGKVKPGMECSGQVSIGDAELPCDASNGYRLKNESTVELVGQACTNLRTATDPVVKARFPCESIDLF